MTIVTPEIEANRGAPCLPPSNALKEFPAYNAGRGNAGKTQQII